MMILGWLTAVQGCPCGDLHLLDDQAMVVHVLITAGKGPTMPITCAYGTWHVDRVFLSCHPGEIGHASLPLLAARYGWLRA